MAATKWLSEEEMRAWQAFVVAATVIDGSNLKDTCRPMTQEQKTAARALSSELVRNIYNRPVTAADQM